MKFKLFIALIALLGMRLYTNAQQNVIRSVQSDLRVSLNPITAPSVQEISLLGIGVTQHSVVWTTTPSPVGVSVAVAASTDGQTFTTLMASTSGASSYTFSGTYQLVRFIVLGLSTNSVISATYFGSQPAQTVYVTSMTGQPLATTVAAPVYVTGMTGQPVLTAGQSNGTVFAVAVDTSGVQITRPAQNLSGPVSILQADTSALFSISAPGNTQIVPISGARSIYVSGLGLTIGSSTATGQTVQFVHGTGTNCATGLTALTGAFSGGSMAITVTTTGVATPVFVQMGGGLGQIFRTPSGQALCAVTTGSQAVSGVVSYTQF